MNRFLLLFALAATVFACRQPGEIIKEVAVTTSWKAQPYFRGIDKIVLNSFADSNYLHFYGSEIFTSTNGIQYLSFSTLHHDYPFMHKLPISSAFMIRPEANGLFFYNPAVVFTGGDYLDMNMSKIDSNFMNFIYCDRYLQNTIAINDSGRCLVPVKIKNSNLLDFFLIKTDRKKRIGYYDPAAGKVSLPWVDSHPFTPTLYDNQGGDNYFLVATDRGIYRIDSAGNVQRTYNQFVDRLFKLKDVWYGFSLGAAMQISKDQGLTWQAYTGIPYDIARGTYYMVGDSIIGTRVSGLFTFHMTGDTYHTRLLKNDGLDGNDVTSISVFRDSVYATTYSGVFVKPLSTFFESKE